MEKTDKKTTASDAAKTFYLFPLLAERTRNPSYVDKTQPLPIIVWISLKWREGETLSAFAVVAAATAE